MIFSKEKWDKGNELRPYIAVSSALSFLKFQTAVRNASGLFIRPIVGEGIVNKLQEIYDGITDISVITEDTPDKDIRLLYYAQRASAFLSFWYDYDEMQVMIGDSGLKRQEAESVKTPYKYQELSMKEGFRQKGFDGLDNLIAFLEENTQDYPEYKDSEYYTQTQESIVRNTKEVNRYYNINNSRLVFLRLKTNFRIIEDTVIAPRLGADLYDDFKAAISSESPEEKYTRLREKLIPVVVFYAVQRLIRDTGSVTDRGLFFQSLKGNEGSYMSNDPVIGSNQALQACEAEADAISYWLLAEQYLKKEFGISRSHAGKIPNRDNNGKKSFWV
ncbi:MAG: hypothetical protein LBQ74_11245 [Prevotella sp.]|jgi:hypothetical protein|nr:hypothetical protein [Prevotella sp.]